MDYYYNSEIKNEFLKNEIDSDSTRKTSGVILHKFANIELEYEMDIAEFPSRLFKLSFSRLGGSSLLSKRYTLEVLRRYIRWCIQNTNLSVNDDLLNIKFSDVSKLPTDKSNLISSPTHLEMYLNNLFSPVDDGGVDILYRCMYWLLFAGIPITDVFNVKKADIDLNGLTVKYDNRSVPIYRESVSAFRAAVYLPKFSSYGKSRDGNYFKRYIERKQSDLLFTSSTDLSYRSIINAINKIKKRPGNSSDNTNSVNNINLMTIWRCGWFYRIYDLERSGLRPDFAPMIKDAIAQSAMNNYAKEFSRRRLLSIETNLKNGYKIWKATFS